MPTSHANHVARVSRRCLLAGWLTLWLLAAFGGLAACGYQHKELFPKEYRTVSVQIDNRTFYRGVEFDLTEALIKEIELRTPYKVTLSDKADTLLIATVSNITQRTLSQTATAGLPQEVEVQMAVDMNWKDARSGKVIRQRLALSSVGRYVPTQPVGDTFSSAQHTAVQSMASEMVSALRQDW